MICSSHCLSTYAHKKIEKRFVKCAVCGISFPNKNSLYSGKTKICQNECLVVRKEVMSHRVTGYTASVLKIMKEYGITYENAREIRRKKASSPLAIVYWTEKGLNENEAKEKISNMQRKNSKQSIDYYLSRGYSDEDAIKLQQEYQSLTSKSQKIENRRLSSRWQIYYWLNMGYTTDEAKEKMKNNGQFGAHTIERYKELYGQNWEEKYQKRIDTCKKYMSVQYYIDTYGEELGFEKYRERTKNFGGVSKIQLSLFDELYNLLPEHVKTYIQYKDNSGEKEFGQFCKENNKSFLYDFVIKKYNIVVEFNGDFWHGNPQIFTDENKVIYEGKTAKDIWNYDRMKHQHIVNRGFNLIVVWEKDYRQDPNGVIERLINQIKELIYEHDKNQVDNT